MATKDLLCFETLARTRSLLPSQFYLLCRSSHLAPLCFFATDTAAARLNRGNHEPFNRLALNESIHNLRDVGDRDAPVKKVIRFD